MAHLIDGELARMHLPLNGVGAVSASVACLANGLGMSVAPNIAVKECAALLATAPLVGQIFAVRSESWIARGPRSSVIADQHSGRVGGSADHGTG